MNCMAKQQIQLQFEKIITNLAGNRFGRDTYIAQVKGKIDIEEKNIIEIPEIIEDVASSFVQGIYRELSEQYGKERALEIMELHSVRPEVMEKIEYAIRVYGI